MIWFRHSWIKILRKKQTEIVRNRIEIQTDTAKQRGWTIEKLELLKCIRKFFTLHLSRQVWGERAHIVKEARRSTSIEKKKAGNSEAKRNSSIEEKTQAAARYMNNATEVAWLSKRNSCTIRESSRWAQERAAGVSLCRSTDCNSSSFPY